MYILENYPKPNYGVELIVHYTSLLFIVLDVRGKISRFSKLTYVVCACEINDHYNVDDQLESLK